MDTFESGFPAFGEPFDYHSSLAASPVLAGWIGGNMGSVNSHGGDIGPMHPSVPENRHNRFTVLIVDDDESIAELLADLLEGEGYRAVIAHDGLAALDYARTKRPDLILSDCMMPGLSGTQLAQELRRSPATRAISLVLMSSTQPRSPSVAHIPFLAKPFEIDDVLELVEQYCRNPVSAQLYGEG